MTFLPCLSPLVARGLGGGRIFSALSAAVVAIFAGHSSPLEAVEPPVLPRMSAGFTAQLVGQEPLVRNPCAMAFDSRGRLFVGQGPQYRSPKPDTPGDTVEILIDTDGDGIFDRAKTFARGLNCVQGLAWHGRDLWVANSPDLTVVRDLDGDDEADEYVLVYTDLGNIEHAIHGLNWAPDGKLYMSKGNSKGLTLPGRIAPKPFRELSGSAAPAGTPDFPEPKVFRKDTYRNTYQDPADDWGREGGVLRCDDLGANLEIVSRGMRNPWDISIDSAFNFLGTDNDQSEGDRILMPFFGAHFGWSHNWSANWTGNQHLPTVPVSGPVFTGSGTGIIFSDTPGWPDSHRGVWFINDYLHRTTYVYRPTWQGALMMPVGGRWEPFARGDQPLFSPVDIENGPDGALYLTGWGSRLSSTFVDGKQTNEGRIFRIAPEGFRGADWKTAKRSRPLAQWKLDELMDDLGLQIPAWRIDAADELARRGVAAVSALETRLSGARLTTGQETWTLWTLGRCAPDDRAIDAWLAESGSRLSVNARVQVARIAGFRANKRSDRGQSPAVILAALRDAEPRVRFAAVQSLAQMEAGRAALDALWTLIAREQDRLVFYSGWHALRRHVSATELRQRLADERGGVRRAALLALLEGGQIDEPLVRPLLKDTDSETAGVAALWLAKRSGNALIAIEPTTTEFTDTMVVVVTAGVKPGRVIYTTDGTVPNPLERSGESGPITIRDTTTIKAVLIVDGKQVGNVTEVTYTKRAPLAPTEQVRLAMPSQPTTVEQVIPLIPRGNAARGRAIVAAAGCLACHRIGAEGGAFGPNLQGMGERSNPEQIVRSILDPNADITEGFGLVSIETRDGKTLVGRRREESGASVEMMLPDGRRTTVVRSNIAKMESLHVSLMPPYAQTLSGSQVADVVAWLSGGEAAAAETSEAKPTLHGFGAELKSDRVVISDNGQPLADFVFDDPDVLRPSFQNVRAPGGVLLTRRYPPAPPEAEDHPTRHPGIWLAFADVNGEDFWRNKARIEHERFTVAPEVSEDTLRFRTMSAFRASDGSVIGSLQTSILITRVPDGNLVTWEAIVVARDRQLVFGDKPEMGFGVRVTSALTEKNGGRIANSDGLIGAEKAWGQVADWCAYSKEIEGRNLGVALFAAPNKSRRPWWHVSDYGLMVSNHFGLRTLPPAPDGKIVVEPGKKLRLQHAVLLFNLPAGTTPDFSAVSRAFRADAAARD